MQGGIVCDVQLSHSTENRILMSVVLMPGYD